MIARDAQGSSQDQCPALGQAKCWVARDTARAESSSGQQLLWLTSQFPLQGVARAKQAVPPGHAGGGNGTKKKRLFSNVEGFKNLFLSLFLESLRLGPKVPGRVALTPSTRRVQF